MDPNFSLSHTWSHASAIVVGVRHATTVNRTSAPFATVPPSIKGGVKSIKSKKVA
jgi:hypothetical protein